MYVEESVCFDAATHVQHEGLAEDVFAIQEHTYHNNNNNNSSQQDVAAAAAAALELEFQQQLNLEMEQCYNNNNNHNNNMQDQSNNIINQGLSCDQSNWGEMNFPPYQNQEDNNTNNNNFHQQNFPNPISEASPYLTTPDLLHMFPLPRCSQSSLLPQKSPNLLTSLGLIGDIDGGGASTSTAAYDPSLVLPLNLPPQTPLLRELFHSFPHGYGLRNLRSNNNNTSFFNGLEERNQALYQDNGETRPFDNGIFEFSAVAKTRDGKETKHFTTERQRRVHFNDKFQALRIMVPNPGKVLLAHSFRILYIDLLV